MTNKENSAQVTKSGFILVDKPEGVTSHDAVDRLRKITGIKKIGHAGTLDPFATGLLIMAIGRESTKKIDHFVKKDKSYLATMELGVTTNTYDKDGIKTTLNDVEIPTREKVVSTISDFLGEQEQIPPMFSAKKIRGKKLYELARKGIEIERKPSKINISKITLIRYIYPLVEIDVTCSSGTYIRSLANDIGNSLGCGAHLTTLQRTAIDNYSIKNAHKIEDINSSDWEKFLFQIEV